MKRKLYLLLGIASLALGVVGAFLPLLPTTPFVLLSAYLFSKSSEKWHNWIISHRLFGQLIKDFHENKTIPLHAKIISISMMWISILITIFTIAKDKPWLQIILALTAIGVSIHIARYKTKRREEKKINTEKPQNTV